MKIGTKPNGIYYLDVRLPDPVSGELKRSRVSLDTRDLGEAKRQRADWLAGTHPKHPRNGGVIAARGREPLREASTSRTSSQRGMTVRRWVDLCQTSLWRTCKGQATVTSNARILMSSIDAAGLEDLLLADVASVHVGQIETAIRERGSYAEGSVKKLMGALSSALTYATDQPDPKTGQAYLVARPKFPTYTIRNIRERVLSDAEELALFECIDARMEAEPARPWRQMGLLLRVLIDTGFRLGEALSLGPASVTTKRWIDRVTGKPQSAIYLGLARYTTKTDKPREVPATARVRALLPTLNALTVKGKFFPWTQGSGGPSYLWLNLRADMAKRGYDLSDCTIHTMRHTCATRLAIGGMDLLGLRDWLGHSDIKITAERYIHLLSSHLYQGAAILDLHGAPPAPEGTEEADGGLCGIHDVLSNGRDDASVGTLMLQ